MKRATVLCPKLHLPLIYTDNTDKKMLRLGSINKWTFSLAVLISGKNLFLGKAVRQRSWMMLES
jgi:hypothetical protein